MDDKTLFSPQAPSAPQLPSSTPTRGPTLSLTWLLCTLLAVFAGAAGSVLVLSGGHSIGPGLALFAVTIVAATGGTRQAFLPLLPAVSVSEATAVPVIAEVIRVNPPGGKAFGTFTVRFATAGGLPQEAEMLMTTPGAIGRQIPGRFDFTNPQWVVADGPNIVSMVDLAFKWSLAVGVLLLVCVPFV